MVKGTRDLYFEEAQVVQPQATAKLFRQDWKERRTEADRAGAFSIANYMAQRMKVYKQQQGPIIYSQQTKRTPEQPQSHQGTRQMVRYATMYRYLHTYRTDSQPTARGVKISTKTAEPSGLIGYPPAEREKKAPAPESTPPNSEEKHAQIIYTFSHDPISDVQAG